ncbi:MAG: hypothetical protein KQI62_00500 [Deltaproteobacteria bacterium]|nr:hypothetical protein [Deltaproteobacteria bacterium]
MLNKSQKPLAGDMELYAGEISVVEKYSEPKVIFPSPQSGVFSIARITPR